MNKYSGLSKTGHNDFDRDGALLLTNFLDISNLQRKPDEKNQLCVYSNNGLTFQLESDLQILGSSETYRHPALKESFFIVKNKIEKILNKRLYQTYYFDRFYFNQQELEYHSDRPACQISVSIHIGSSDSNQWPFYIETPDKRIIDFTLAPGDAVLYKGTECPHWRKPIKSGSDDYYHQTFMHYVLQDGHFAEYAFDKGTDM